MFAIWLVLYFSHRRVGYLFSFLVPEYGGCDMNSPYNFDLAISVCSLDDAIIE